MFLYHRLTKLLDKLLVLVELLEVLDALAVNGNSLSLLAMLHISQHAHLEAWARDVRQLDSARETLVFLGIIVFQANLELNGLRELALLGLGALQLTWAAMVNDQAVSFTAPACALESTNPLIILTKEA